MKNENAFKQKLYSHTLPVREGLWEAIEVQLPPARTKRRFPFFWMILFGSAFAGGAVMIGSFHSRNTPHPSSPSVATVMPNAIPYGADSPSNSTATESTHTPATAQQANPETDLLSQNNLNLQSRNTHASPGISSPPGTSGSRLQATPSLPLSEKASSDAESVADHQIGTASPSVAPYPLRNDKITAALPAANVVLTDGDKFPFFNLQPDPHCYTFGGYATGFALSADLVGGPGFSVRTFEDTGGESVIYADARQNTERKQYAWTLGGRLNLHLNNGLGAKIGLSYHQAGDILDYRDSLATQSSTRIDSFWAADGTFLYADTVRIFIPGTLVKKIHNTYRQLDVPLLLSYELILSRSILMINAGPVLNLTSSHKGQILDTALHPRPLSPGGTPGNQVNAYKTQLGLSLYLGAGVLFPLGSHTSVILEPRFLFRIKPVTLPHYALKEHRHFAGLHLGLRYHFN